MGRHRAITPLDSPAPSSHAPARLSSLPSSAPLCSPLYQLWFPGSGQDTGEGSVILRGGRHKEPWWLFLQGLSKLFPSG